MRPVRTPMLSTLCLLGVASTLLASCSGHHTSDELVVTPAAAEEEEKLPALAEHEEVVVVDKQDAGAGAADAGASAQCARETDPVARLLCSATAGGNGDLSGIINGVLGGGMGTMSCARETDPIALLLCGAMGTGGTGLDGIINGLLGGGGITSLLSDGGIERVLTTALVEVVRGVLDDLIGSLFGGNSNAGAGTGRGTTRQLVLPAGAKSRGGDELLRTAEECAQVAHEDQLTRLLCARQALDTIALELQ